MAKALERQISMRNLPRKRNLSTTLTNLLEDSRVRRREHEGQTWYGAADIAAVLTGSMPPTQWADQWGHEWNQLKAREPRLSQLASMLEFPGDGGELLEMLPMEGILRVVQSLSSPTAEKIKNWLAAAGHEQIEEQQDPELAWVRLQKLYDYQGYSHRWVQKRLRGMAAQAGTHPRMGPSRSGGERRIPPTHQRHHGSRVWHGCQCVPAF